ncbi:MAG: prolyl oligopeptidase family serine peptidase [Tannerellaceae bacterium]
MNYLKQLVVGMCLMAIYPLNAQVADRAMTFEDLAGWNRIAGQAISDNGQWVACRMEPWVGDTTVQLYNAKGEELKTFRPAEKFAFSSSSRYLLVTQQPTVAETEALILKKTKANKMPMNKLIVYNIAGSEEMIDSLRSYKLAESGDWIAYQRGRKDSMLYVRSLDGKQTFQYPAVSEYLFAKKSPRLLFVSSGDSLQAKAGLFALNPEKGTSILMKEGKGVFKQATFNEQGDRLAFLYSADKDSVYKSLSLWMAEGDGVASLIAQRADPAFPKGWLISEHGNVSFSKNSTRLFFGTSPEPMQTDSTVLEENRPNVQVWSWDEPVQYTVQSYNQKKELKRSYQAVYNLKNRKTVQLATESLYDIQLGDEGNAPLALLSTSRPYSVSSLWEGRTRSDYYTVSLETGEQKPVLKADYGQLSLSPKGIYAYWYAETDSCWRTLTLADGKVSRLTTPQSFTAWDEENDVPNYAPAHGLAGWTTGDKQLLIYDRYDIWQFAPDASITPINLTVNGRKDAISYRLIQLDKETRAIDLSQPQLLNGFNETSKGSGYYSAHLNAPKAPEVLISGNFLLKKPIKAKQADALIYTAETFEQYPDIRLTTGSFKQSVQLTHGDAQQKGLNWGTAELVSWLSLDGRRLEGVVYKPKNFDPNKKYPMVVNFYERNSETLYNYHMPEPHRSTLDYHFYNSHEYIIFNPDIRYVDGYPGESCFNCVMPGITSLIAKGYINEKAIAAQGHSWGGYQVAYLATRTTLFAAIESGAPVVNMFSAYGGIRWGSGMARSFQYEHEQSRIGGTPWSAPLLYLENSPLFNMNKVQTPILIMHNDADGHVPWYQGIEYFVALKRLQKPAWLLNYTTEPHWPMRMANRIDFQTRMYQFFSHYLTGSPQPAWMSDGLPATKQPFELGY